jgi:hypothetical protein
MQNEGGAREFLFQLRLPKSFQDSFLQNIARTPLRFFCM